MPIIFRKCIAKYDVHSNVGTIKVPSLVPTNWGWLHVAEDSTHLAEASRLPTSVFLYFCFSKPKHQSGENLVWTTTRNDKVILVCLLVITRHAKY